MSPRQHCVEGFGFAVRALLSCSDKTGIVALARGLVDLGYEVVSTGGTFDALTAAGLPAVPISDVTGFPELLDGRVKTLHPAIHGGILARADDPRHQQHLVDHGVTAIDLVAVNLYPFARTVADRGVSDEDAIEQIDIGGPALIRAAAKNHASVVVLTDPSDYEALLAHLVGGAVGSSLRRELAAKAFQYVAAYDALVAAYLGSRKVERRFPVELTVGLRRDRTLRYGENPHQRAAAYRRVIPGGSRPSVLDAVQLAGKQPSFNNLLDMDASWQAASIDPKPTVAIVKHTIPCGLATRDTLSSAFDAALAGDPVSAFGGIVALNALVTAETAAKIHQTRFDVVVAPAFADEAVELLRQQRSLRIFCLQSDAHASDAEELDLRIIGGGVLVQTPDTHEDDPAGWRVVSQRPPTQTELSDLAFAWRV
ncbi:MAG: bifunctional phosphoribosylaminoimidazolecarboxamide formyltransferase/IMP cyclohydrolase, partial [Chloroflexia bacterium]|nr:bifunctional phosphoribosylaminoimidazolecarboxamide formyltransferase/IMP cyclohydrolase [Chloroflexia bacterium]